MTKIFTNLEDQDPIENFESTIKYLCLKKEEKDNLAEMEARQEVERWSEKLWKAICKLTGKKFSGVQTWDFTNVDPRILSEARDIILGNEKALIKQVHRVLPYSLIKGLEIERFVPEKNGEYGIKPWQDSSVRSLEILQEYTSENTEKAFYGDLVYWNAWFSAIGCNFEVPFISVDLIKTFIVQHIEGLNSEVDQRLFEQGYKSRLGTHSLATIKRRIASLSIFLDRMKWDNPCREKEVKILLEKLSKKYKRFNRRKPITKEILEDMIKTCKSSQIDTRDKAILLFGWASGGRRRSEIIEATVENLTKTSDGDYLYNLNSSKTNQTGEDDIKPIKDRAAKALTDWLELSKVTTGYIFRSIGKGGIIKGGLSGNDIRRIVKKRAKLAGYDERHFSAHSIRRGFVTEGGKQGKPILDIMKMTSHKSVETAMKYYDAGNIANNSCANLLG